MEQREVMYYTWIAIGVLFLWSFVKLAIPKIKEVRQQEDWKKWFTESIITHKVAELCIWVPSFFIILWAFYESKNSMLSLIDHTDEIMMFGGILGFYSFFDARKKYWWAYPFLIICLWGIFGGWLARNYILPFATH